MVTRAPSWVLPACDTEDAKEVASDPKLSARIIRIKLLRPHATSLASLAYKNCAAYLRLRWGRQEKWWGRVYVVARQVEMSILPPILMGDRKALVGILSWRRNERVCR